MLLHLKAFIIKIVKKELASVGKNCIEILKIKRLTSSKTFLVWTQAIKKLRSKPKKWKSKIKTNLD